MTSLPNINFTRLGTLMEIEPGNALEEEGVLNPATARGADGSLYLYPRLVGRGNRSCIGRAKVVFEDGVPAKVERLGVALAVEEGWEHGRNHGGVEDPRITWIETLGLHIMTYVAFGPIGPRPAIAVSEDGVGWRRIGPLHFGYEEHLDTDLNLFPNKDVVFFPEVVSDPKGEPSLAMLHRPMWDVSYVRWPEDAPLPTGTTDSRPGIWISYVPIAAVRADIRALTTAYGHRQVAIPEFAWEEAKIGAGPAPLRIPEGWLVIHHGVTGVIEGDGFAPQKDVRYEAGAILLDANDPSRVLARSAQSLMAPETEQETNGTVANVVFPTAIETIGGEHFVFYGMADTHIGVAKLSIG